VSISAPFIHRPVATSLLTLGLALAGGLAFFLLPVSPMPNVDYPVIVVTASLPGASPETVATSVTTPLERHLGVIADVADRVVVMYAGRVVERAPVDELFAHPQHHYTAGLLVATPTPGRHAGTDRLQEIPGLVPVLSIQPDACTFADRCLSADAQCLASAPALSSDRDVTSLPADHLVACWHPCGESAKHQEAGE